MARPGTDIALMNGQLGITPPSEFGTSLLMVAAPAAPTAGYGTMFIIKSKADAKTAFANSGNAGLLKAIVSGFFAEAPEGNTLYVVAMAQTTTLTQLADAANVEKALIPAKGAIRMVAFIKYPAGSYAPTVTNGFDADVHTAVTAAQALANTWLAKKKPIRCFIQGFACTGAPAAALDYAVTTNRNCFVVAPEVALDGGLSTLLFLGRAVKVNPQQNVGRILSGSLNIDPTFSVTIGSVNIESLSDTILDGYFAKRYITFEPNKASSGFVISDDIALVAGTDDYNNLAYGRVSDNLIRIADRVYYLQVKNDVDVDEDGRIDMVIEKALENKIIDAVNQEMGGQLSSNRDGTASVVCRINPDPVLFASLYSDNNINTPNLNLLQAGKLYVFVTGRPKGCLRNISIYIGYGLN